MIYLNGKLIDYTDAKQRESEMVKWIGDRINEMRKELPMIIEFPKSLGTKNEKGFVEFPQSRPISVVANIQKFGASYEVRWSERQSIEVQGKDTKYFPPRIKKFGAAYGAFNGAVVYTEKDVEWAFFLKFISPQKDKDFIIRDEVKSALDVIEAAKRKAKVDAILPGLPNSISDDIVLIVAQSFGIGNAEEIISKYGQVNGMAIVRSRLHDIITNRSLKDKNVIDEFVRRTQVDEKTKMLSLVYRSINNRVVYVEQDKTGKYYKFSSGEVLCQIAGVNHEEYLATFLMRNKDMLTLLRDKLNTKLGKESKNEDDDGEIDLGDAGDEGGDSGISIEKLRELYSENIGNVPPAYKNNKDWLTKKLTEKGIEL